MDDYLFHKSRHLGVECVGVNLIDDWCVYSSTMIIEGTAEFGSNADNVWLRVKDLRRIPEFWHGTKSVRIEEEGAGFAKMGVVFAFGGRGKAVVKIEDDKRRVSIEYVKGPFVGTQTISVGEGIITARWDISFKGVFRFVSAWNKGHFKSGTLHALERLAGSEPNSSVNPSEQPSSWLRGSG